MSYLALKHLHIMAVIISGSLFFARLALKLNDRSIPRWLKIVPHINDSALLGFAIAMLVTGGIHPLNASWVVAKIVALTAYIFVANAALKSNNKQSLFVLGSIAWLIFGYIITVALTKQWSPLDWFGI